MKIDKVRCPFCNAGAPCRPPVSTGDMGKWYVKCGHCGATGPEGKTREKAWSYWNGRRRTFCNTWEATK